MNWLKAVLVIAVLAFSVQTTYAQNLGQTGNPQENSSYLQGNNDTLQGSTLEQVLGIADLYQTNTDTDKINIENTPQAPGSTNQTAANQPQSGSKAFQWLIVGAAVLGVLALITAVHKILSSGVGGPNIFNR